MIHCATETSLHPSHWEEQKLVHAACPEVRARAADNEGAQCKERGTGLALKVQFAAARWLTLTCSGSLAERPGACAKTASPAFPV